MMMVIFGVKKVACLLTNQFNLKGFEDETVGFILAVYTKKSCLFLI
jgi:hypothetical protein